MSKQREIENAIQGIAMERRRFLRLTSITGGGLVLASVLPGVSRAAEDAVLVASEELNAFIQVDREGRITIYSANPEMGQGVKTTLPMIIAEELGARWEDVEVLQSPVDERFGRQGAGGSTTVPRNFDLMRRLGASAREMFISAGALVMELPRDEMKTADSKVVHESGRFMTFGQLASIAAEQDVPDEDDLVFKPKDEYTIIGASVSGVDNLVIATGASLFGIDSQVPGMLFAAYQKCPAIGGKVRRANVDAIKQMPGVVDAFIIEGNGNPRELLAGVAVVGTNTHAVFKAKDALEIEWDETDAANDSWTGLVAKAKALHGTRSSDKVVDNGDVDERFADPDNQVLEAFYEYQFVSHLCLEPMNCTASYKKDERGENLELWVPTQFPGRAKDVAQKLFDIAPDNVTVHQMRLGGSFGRRVSGEFVAESIAISKQVGAPVKLTWSREDSMRHDFFRAGGFQSVKGAVNPEGKLVAFEKHFIGMDNYGRPVSGGSFRPTEFPFLNLADGYGTQTRFEIGIPCGPWRAPGSNTNGFVVQCFLDELAHAAGRDYLEFLTEIMGEPRWFDEGNVRSLNTGRAVGVIRKAAEEAGWGRDMPSGRGLGLAFYFSHAGHIAEVADVSVDANKKLTVHEVTVAVDVGPIINRSGALNQVEGAVIDGLSAMMGQKITFENGRVEQTNFDQYPVLRIGSAPKVTTHFIESDYPPTGLGEPALPPLAPAVGNAIFAATGERVRKMPLIDLGYSI